MFAAQDDIDEDFGTHWLLDRRTRMLYRGNQLFVNGEVAPCKPEAGLKLLADQRVLPMDTRAASTLSNQALDALDDWVNAGWVVLADRMN